MPTDAGAVSQIAVFLPSFARSSKHSSIGAEGENLLVVGSTLGKVSLDLALLHPKKPIGTASLLRRAETRLATYINELQLSPPQLTAQPQIITTPEEQLQNELENTTLIEEEEGTWLNPTSGFVSIAADLV